MSARKLNLNLSAIRGMLGAPQSVLCLDWDKRSLRMVAARVGKGAMRLDDAHSVRLPQGLNCDDPAAMGGFIREQLKKHGIATTRAVVDVSRDRAVINRLKLPPTPAHELPGAVRFQALRELPFPLDDAQIDYVVMEREGTLATEVLLAAVRLETLKQITQTTEAAGLTLARVGLRPYANLMSITRLAGLADRRVLVIDIGPSTTEIDVIRGGLLVFSRAANVGVDSSDAPPEAASADETEAAPPLRLSHETRTGVVDELLVEITRTLQAFRATENGAVIDQIVVAGGTGVETALLSAVEERFGLPSMIFDPTAVLGVSADEAGKLRSFGAALGLAWGMAREGLFQLDFLNPKKPLPPSASMRRRLRPVGIAAGILLLGGGAYVIGDLIHLSGVRDQLNKDNEELQTRVLEVRKLKEKSTEVDRWDQAAEGGLWLKHLLSFTQAAVEPGKQMLVTNAVCTWQNNSITLRVLCNLETANDFVARLNELEVEGAHPYRATPGTWQEGGSTDSRFKGSVDVRVDLVALKNTKLDIKTTQDKAKLNLTKF